MKNKSLKFLSIAGASLVPFAITPLIVSCSKNEENLSNVKMYDKNYRILFSGAGEILDYDGNATELEIPEYLENNSVTSSPYYGKKIQIKRIGYRAFQWDENEDSGRSKLQKVTLPNSLVSINTYAFENNELSSIVIPDSVTRIGQNAFENNNQLTQLILSKSLTEIDAFTFCNTSLSQIIIPNSVTYIGSLAFYNTKLTNVTLPPNCEYISDAFPENCVVNGGIKIE